MQFLVAKRKFALPIWKTATPVMVQVQNLERAPKPAQPVMVQGKFVAPLALPLVASPKSLFALPAMGLGK